MDKSKYLTNVRDQYENYPFPQRNPRDEKRRLFTSEMDMLPKINHYCFNGKQTFDQGFRVLVAGGGTGDAVIYLAHQLKDSNAKVVYLDMSESSMEIAKARAAARKLDNIQWIHGSILELPNMDLEPFDYINCVGVLHHMADPNKGLSSLASVLAPDGAMGIMVYGHYGRIDIYATQDMMRLVTVDEPDLDQRVEYGKGLLKSIPPSNLLMRGRERERVLHQFFTDESDLVDCFLHEQDQAYTVPKLYDFIESADLKLVEFTNYDQEGVCRIEYDPDMYVDNNPKLSEKLAKLSTKDRQSVAEVINGCIGLHSFYLSKKTDTIAKFDDPENVPSFLTVGAVSQCHRLQKLADGKQAKFQLRNGNHVWMDLGSIAKELIGLIDGKRTLGEITDMLLLASDLEKEMSREELLQRLQPDLDILNMLNWVVLRHSSVNEFSPLETVATFTLAKN